MLISTLVSAFALDGTAVAPGAHSETVMVAPNGTCTGVLLAPEWVLTAAYCVFSSNPDAPSSPIVRVLEGDGGPLLFPGEHDVERMAVHPQYVASEPFWHAWSVVGEEAPDGQVYAGLANDLVLLKLDTPAFGQPVPVNTAPLVADSIGAIPVTTVGFGLTAFAESDSGTKREASISLTGVDSAPPTGRGVFYGERATCHGDMGAPALVATDRGPLLLGVATLPSGCDGAPSTFTPIAPHLDWLREHVDGLQEQAYTPPRIACSHQLPDGIGSLGAAPLELRCTADHADLAGLDGVTWHWGDGTPAEARTEALEQASHLYTEQGHYRVRACFEHPDGEGCVTAPTEITVCDVPEVSFEVEDLGAHTLRLINHTPIDLPGCVSEARWEIYTGTEATGEPLVVRTAWEPVIELEDAGPYTIVLDVGGIAGTGAASATVDVGRSGGCDVSGAGLLGLFVVPLALGRRRRTRGL